MQGSDHNQFNQSQSQNNQDNQKHYQEHQFPQNVHNDSYNFYNGYMFPPNQIGYSHFDTKVKRHKHFLFPKYHTIFNGLVAEINELKNYQSKKWGQFQRQLYFDYLNTVQQYIKANIFTGKVNDYNYFQQVLLNYCVNVNPAGKEIYDKQKEFLMNKKNGTLGAKKKPAQKNQNREEEKNKPKEIVKQQKQQEITRKPDPTFQMHQLLKRKWQDNGKYVSKELLWQENANLVFIGHVDSGKSTLTGNILKHLNQFDEQEYNRNVNQAKQNKMEEWIYAYMTDIDPAQRIRGKTIECSKLIFTLKDRRYTLFDAPGHRNYVPSMIMGACQSDIAVLIISAKQGQFQSGFQKDGQTKQHAMLAKVLGVQGLIVVITKMGTADWSEARYNSIKTAVVPFLESSCGFDSNYIPFIPVDSIKNIGIHQRATQTWYNGPCLIEVLNNFKLPERNAQGPLRIPVIDKFKDAGVLYIYGKIQSGIIEEGQTVSVLPQRRYLTIKQILNARDQRMPFALAGENVKLRIKGITQEDVYRGDVVCSNSNYCQESEQFKADITLLELPESKKLMAAGFESIMHMHAIVEQIQILKVEAVIDPQTFSVKTAKFLKSGDQGKVVIKVPKPICLEKYEFMPSLGRFTLREEGKTIGFGQVTRIKPAKGLTKEQKDQLIVNQAKKDKEDVTVGDIEEKMQGLKLNNI